MLRLQQERDLDHTTRKPAWSLAKSAMMRRAVHTRYTAVYM